MSDAGPHRLLISIAVMSATVMQVLDTTIVNVALPHMQGQLGATPDQISWVLTSYMVASGIFMPLTGYFSDRLGQKRYLLYSVIGFVVASVLCGLSTSLTEIVIFRLLQGITGAALVPLSQSVMVTTYPHEERGKAMAVWGIGVMVGPILGPTLGGWLTETLNWRWNFFINLPVGVLSAVLVWRYIPDTERRTRNLDAFGLFLLVLALGGLQMVLDRGSRDDWFDSVTIQFTAFISVVGFIGYWLHSRSHTGHLLFDPVIFRDRNFATASVLMAMMGLGLFGAMMLQPLMLEGLMGYPTIATGLALAPRGVASMISMMIVGKLINRTDPRLLISTGIVIFSAGSYMTTLYTLQIDTLWVVGPMILQGLGLGMVFVPLSTLAFSTLPPRHAAEAAGLYSLLRTIGSGIGISLLATVMTRHAQIAWHHIGGNIQPYNGAATHYLGSLGLAPDTPAGAAILTQELARQSQMVAFLDAYTFVTWSFAAMLPLVFIMRRGKKQGGAPAVAAD